MKTIKYLALAMIFKLGSSTIHAQFSQWGNLKPGPYAVGFRMVMITDSTRYYNDFISPLDKKTATKQYRKIPLFIWYPAKGVLTSKFMRYGDYFHYLRYENPWAENPDEIASFNLTQLKKGFGISDSAFKEAAKVAVPAIVNAVPVKQKFPIVLHTHAMGVLMQTILVEFLASHGYVVLSYPRLGPAPLYYLWTENNIRDDLSNIDDVGVVISKLRSVVGYADVTNISFAGTLCEKGIGHQFKNGDLRAIAFIGGSLPLRIKELPYYENTRFRIPILYLPESSLHDAPLFVDSLIYAPRWIVKIKNFAHSDLYPFYKTSLYKESAKYVTYELTASAVLEFLNTMQKGNKNTVTFTSIPADRLVSVDVHAAAPLTPSETEFLSWIKNGNIDRALSYFNDAPGRPLARQEMLRELLSQVTSTGKPYITKALKIYFGYYPADPGQLLSYMYRAAASEKIAIDAFDFVHRLFPQSPYPYDGLADYYEREGNKQKAMENVIKAKELLGAATDITNEERESLQQNIKEREDRLKN